MLLIKLRNRDPFLRDAAITALGYIGSRKAVDPLIELYKEVDEHTQTSIIYALARIGGSEETYSFLRKTIENPVHTERTKIALRLIGTQRAYNLLASSE
jgi:HEAT repeat protein